jgi:hypothetical protein
MKNIVAIGLLALGITSASAEVTSQDLLNAVDKMTPSEADAFSRKLESKLWRPVPEGFFSRLAVDVGVSGGTLESLDMSSVTRSGGELDLDSVGGAEAGLLWRAFNPQLRLGLRMEAWTTSDSDLEPSGYSRADLEGGSVLLVANYQWVRRDTWLLWTEVGAGGGSAQLDTIDTPAGQATTLRSFDKTYNVVALQGGLSWRFNPVMSLFGAGGYQFAESVDFEEGGEDSAVELDASGPFARFGLGFNY